MKKRILKWLGMLIGIVVLIGILQLAWGLYREPIAEKQAQDFCAAIKPGQSADGIVEQAVASGAEAWLAKWVEVPGGLRVLTVTYIGMPPFSRHTCMVRATNVIVSATYVHMD